MRQFFFLGILILGVLAGLVYFLWSIVTALYQDWLMGRGVREIQRESAMRRREREEQAARRLDNGCEHEFDQTLGGFPPGTCHKCGLERERPYGACDHVWRQSRDAIASSYCETCGKRYISPHVTLRNPPETPSRSVAGPGEIE
jgi:hypothetical protein